MSSTLTKPDFTTRDLVRTQLSASDQPAATIQKTSICFLIDNLSVAGTENHLLGLIEDLDRDKFEPILVLLDGQSETSQKLEPESCEVIRLGITSFFYLSIIGKTFRFVRWLRQNNIEVLQVYFPDSSLFGAVTGRLAGVKKIIRTRRNAGYWMTRLHRWRGRLISWMVDATIVNSEASAQSVIEQERASENSVTIIPNGVNLNRFEFDSTAMTGKRNGEIRIGMLTNLRSVKRVDVFIDAASRLQDSHPNVTFEIAGEGELRSELQAKIDGYGLSEHVKILGSVNEVPAFLQQLDVFVTCSESEGLSNSTLEAMASRLPIVATDIPGNHSLVDNEVNGLMVPVGDDEQLAFELARLVDDQYLAEKLGSAARQFVSENFEQSRMIKKYEAVYRQGQPEHFVVPTETKSNRSLKSTVKWCLLVLAVVLTFPFWIFVRLTTSEQVFLSAAQWLSMMPGLVGVFLRRGFYVMTLDKCSDDCHIDFGTWFSHRKAEIAAGVYIGARCTIGMVSIGPNVLIGSNVDILSGKNQHNFDDTATPINAQGGEFQQVALGEGCWIGNSSVVMSDIGTESIVGAGSVVTKAIPAWSIAVGNPAKVIKERTSL